MRPTRPRIRSRRPCGAASRPAARAPWAAALLACAACNAVFGLDPLTYEEPTRRAPPSEADAEAGADASDASTDASPDSIPDAPLDGARPDNGSLEASADASPE